MSDVKTIRNTEEFDTFIQGEGAVKLVRFWATWCGPCIALGPIYNEAAKELKETAGFAEVDIDVAPAIAGAFGIRSVPTVIAFKDGKPTDSIVGLNPKDSYVRLVHKLAGMA